MVIQGLWIACGVGASVSEFFRVPYHKSIKYYNIT